MDQLISQHHDVLIIGSGPVGATFARKLVEGGRSVCMLEAGAYHSKRPGAHMKNSVYYQRNIDKFTPVVASHLLTASVPTSNGATPTLAPIAFKANTNDHARYMRNNLNPEQDPFVNLDGAAVCYAVGGMGTHWTCMTPRPHPTMERSDIISGEEWSSLYDEAEKLLMTSRDNFQHSVRNTIVKEKLQAEYPKLKGEDRPQNMAFAGYRLKENPEFMHWTGSDDIFGPLLDDSECKSRFTLKAEHLVEKLVLTSDGDKIDYAIVRDLQKDQCIRVHANQFVLTAGAILTPQILFNSGIRPNALGHYLSEQPCGFAQVVLNQSLVDSVWTDSRFADGAKKHHEKYPLDPLPFKFSDPDPQLYIPVSAGRPWHCVVHRDAFHYGDLDPHIDSRTVVDFRWFSILKPRFENYVTFSESIKDSMGMPQPTFNVTLTDEEKEESNAMMKDMIRAATAVGGFIPESLPQFVPHGVALHITGTIRMGKEDDGTSVVDEYSRVWGIDNLCLGGNGVIPTGTACNPTLTSVALAIRSAGKILERLTHYEKITERLADYEGTFQIQQKSKL
ncbi:uncharacterized protein [Amphiura filiformis]|uniref:uncharacterized protein n=1 Tax=Amphiura filiformis TaxID=82378 RepID=UPI003B22717F